MRPTTGGALTPIHIWSQEGSLRVNDGGADLSVTLGSGTLDAFGRLRVSEPFTVWDGQFEYSKMPLYWNESTSGGGTATHLPNESAVRMRCTTASGSKVVRQTKRYHRYQPGKSQRVLATGVMGAAKENVRQRIGLFDDDNGLFFEQTGSGLSVVRRSNVTGTPVDTAIPQASWNIDSLDGTGPSGITVDTSKAQIFNIDFEWLGVGSVRFGFVIDGKYYYCHQINHANNVTSVYMGTANLPVRYEIENTGVAASETDLLQICSEVSSEGGVQERSLLFSVGNGPTLKAVSTTEIPIISIRAGDDFPSGSGSGKDNRTLILPQEINVFSEDNVVYFRVYLNPALTGASWVNYNTTHSGVQYDVSATAFTGGLQVGAGYVPASNQTKGNADFSVLSDLALAQNIASNSGDILTVTAIRRTLDSDVGAVITWKEIY